MSFFFFPFYIPMSYFTQHQCRCYNMCFSVCILLDIYYLSELSESLSTGLTVSSSSRETTVTRKTSVPSAPTGPMTGGCDGGGVSSPPWRSGSCPTAPLNPRLSLCVMSVIVMMPAPSTAPAALTAKPTMDTATPTENPPPQSQSLPHPRTSSLWTPRSVDPPPLVEVVEDYPL